MRPVPVWSPRKRASAASAWGGEEIEGKTEADQAAPADRDQSLTWMSLNSIENPEIG